MAIVTREFGVAYGSGDGSTIGKDSETYIIEPPFRISHSYTEFTFEATVLVIATTEAGFSTACSDLESKWTLPDQNLVITHGSTTTHSFVPSSNTGFNTRASVEKVGSDVDTGRSRRYIVRVEVDTPADLTGRNGRQDSTVTVDYDQADRAIVTITGTYTALSANDATAQYEAQADTYASSVLSGLSITDSRLVSEETAADDQDKIINFTRVYREVLNEDTWEIVYGSGSGATVGSGGTYFITGPITVRHDYDEFEVEANVVIIGADEAALETAVQDLQAAWRKPDQAITVNLNSSAVYTFDPSTNSGFNTRASAQKVGDSIDTENSALYRVTATAQLPADLTGRNGRRDSTVRVEYTASGQALVTISGVYTALSSNGANAQYAASIASYASSVMTGLSISNTELISEETEQDDQDKVLRFERVYREILFAQDSAATDNSSIVADSVRVEVLTPAPGDTDPSATRLRDVIVSYAAAVDKAVSIDLEGLWTDTLKAYLVDYAVARAGGGQAALIEEAPSYDPSANTLAATMRLKVVAGGELLEHTQITRSTRDFGIILTPVWDDDPFSRDLDYGPVSWLRTTTTDELRLGTASEISSDSPVAPQGEGWIPIGIIDDVEPFTIGEGSDTIELHRRVTILQEVFVKVVEAGASGGGSRV